MTRAVPRVLLCLGAAFCLAAALAPTTEGRLIAAVVGFVFAAVGGAITALCIPPPADRLAARDARCAPLNGNAAGRSAGRGSPLQQRKGERQWLT